MGFLTEIVIHNDALYEFEKDPKAFGQAILDGIHKANQENKQVSVPFKTYSNYISVEKSRHADHHVLFVHKGNCLLAIGPGEQSWEDLVKRTPNIAKSFYKEAQSLLRAAKKSFGK